MSVAVRVIPCLDVDAGRVVKGVNFLDLRDAGDPVEMARVYDAEGADSSYFSTSPRRARTGDDVRRGATHGRAGLHHGPWAAGCEPKRTSTGCCAGADKVGVNTAAIARPELIAEVARRFDRQVLVCRWTFAGAHGHVDRVRVRGDDARRPSRRPRCGRLGTAGRGARRRRNLLNSMDAGKDAGRLDLGLIAAVRSAVDVPVIASGGAGALEDFAPAVMAGPTPCSRPASCTSASCASATSRKHLQPPSYCPLRIRRGWSPQPAERARRRRRAAPRLRDRADLSCRRELPGSPTTVTAGSPSLTRTARPPGRCNSRPTGSRRRNSRALPTTFAHRSSACSSDSTRLPSDLRAP